MDCLRFIAVYRTVEWMACVYDRCVFIFLKKGQSEAANRNAKTARNNPIRTLLYCLPDMIAEL
jgi:hypothetical protein